MKERNKMTTITHFTNRQHIDNIYADGEIKLEGCNIEAMVNAGIKGVAASGMDLNVLWRALQKQYRLAGRYVWFTQQSDVKSISSIQSFSKAAFVFDAEEIGAVRWMDIARRKAMRSNKARKLIKILNDVAQMNGDDVNSWWVVEKNVELKYCKNLSDKRTAKQEVREAA